MEKLTSSSRKNIQNESQVSPWLSRTSFSRAIYYRVDSNTISQLSFPFLEEFSGSIRNQKKKPERTNATREPDRKICTNQDGYNSCISSSEAGSTEFSTDGNYVSTSTSVDSSPAGNQLHRSSSLPSSRGAVPHREELSEEEDGDQLKNLEGSDSIDATRAASWSEYFATSGNEYAVEEAEDWMVNLSELLIGPKFASGAYSRLYLGKYQNAAVAVKMLKQPVGNKEIADRLERQFKREVNVLSRVHHRNIVKFVGACRKPPVCCIITEYLPLGSIRAYLHNKQSPFSIPLKLVFDMALDIAHGMEYLHSQGVLHRDLKSQNLVLAEDLTVKITDFGVACFESEWYSLRNDDIGTYRWMAPEMFSGKPCSRKADVYSFGLVVWELLTGQVPFEGLSPVQAAFAVLNKHARPPLPLNCPSPLANLVHHCWATDPNKRPDFSKIVAALEDMRSSCQSQGDSTFLPRPHKHSHLLSRLFGCVA